MKGWLTVKKLLVLTIVAGVLGLSGLGCSKESTGAKKTEVKSTTEAKPGTAH